MADREEVVDNLEAVLPSGVVGGGDGADLGKLGGSVVCGGAGQPRVSLRVGEDACALHFKNVKTGITPAGAM